MMTNLSTPHDVTASLLSPTSVHLRWASMDQPISADDGMLLWFFAQVSRVRLTLCTSQACTFATIDTYFLVDMEARNDLSGDYERSRQVKVKANSFILDQLEMGTAYRFRVRTHSGRKESEPSDWAVLRMPTGVYGVDDLG